MEVMLTIGAWVLLGIAGLIIILTCAVENPVKIIKEALLNDPEVD